MLRSLLIINCPPKSYRKQPLLEQHTPPRSWYAVGEVQRFEAIETLFRPTKFPIF